MTAVNNIKIKSLIKYVNDFLFGKTNIFEDVCILRGDEKLTYQALILP